MPSIHPNLLMKRPTRSSKPRIKTETASQQKHSQPDDEFSFDA